MSQIVLQRPDKMRLVDLYSSRSVKQEKRVETFLTSLTEPGCAEMPNGFRGDGNRSFGRSSAQSAKSSPERILYPP